MTELPQIIAVAGGSGSGKTTLAKKIQKLLFAPPYNQPSLLISQDSYYRDQSEKFDHDGGSVNFDHPDAIEFSLLANHRQALKAGCDISLPRYDFATHKRLGETIRAQSEKLIFVDGTLLLSQDSLLPFFDQSIFIEVDEPTRLARRLKRDVEERGRTPEGVREQFFKQVKIMHDLFVEPSKANASLAAIWKNDRNVVKILKPDDSLLQKNLCHFIHSLNDRRD